MIAANNQLVDFFETAPKSVVWSLLEMMETFSQRTVTRIKRTYSTADQLPRAKSRNRRKVASQLADQLRYNGSHDLAYGWRKMFCEEAGANYSEIVRDVIRFFNKQLKKKVEVPRIASLEEYEEILCGQLLNIALQGKTEEELICIFADAGMKKEAALESAREMAACGAAGVGIVWAVKLLGREVVSKIVREILQALLVRLVGKEAAKKIVELIFKKVTPRVATRCVSAAGWALFAWDVIVLLPGPARRVTVPCVALISAERCLARMKEV